MGLNYYGVTVVKGKDRLKFTLADWHTYTVIL